MSDALLNLDAISYGYGANAWCLHDVSLALRPGEVLGIIGPNGAGKSTLLRIAAGTVQPDGGRVMLDGRDIKRIARRSVARTLGYLPQHVSSTFDYRVEEVVAMGRYAHLRGAGFLRAGDLEIIERCLELTETKAYRDRPMSQLSGGERQRVLLASVLAQQVEVLLLDEPTTGLDLHHQVSFFDLLSRLARKGIAVATVTHDLNLAGLYCDKLLLLRNGRALRQGPVGEVIRSDVLADVYPGDICISRHPQCDKPVVLPLPQATDNSAEAGI